MSYLFLLFYLTNPFQKVIVQPLDFQNDEDPITHVKGMRSLDKMGDFLVFVPKRDPSILLINPKSLVIRKIGGRGGGPGEFGVSHPWGVSSYNGSLWVLNHHREKVSLFVNESFQTSFKNRQYQLLAGPYMKYAFAHNDLFVVIPDYPASGHLANVYDYAGEIQMKVGEILPIDPEVLTYNPALNNTIWRYHAGKWFCLFVYRPTIKVFNDQFKLEREVTIVGEEVDLFEEKFHNQEKDKSHSEIPPHFTDFQVTGDRIYVLCYAVLYEMDHQGKVLSRTGFYANDEAVERFGFRPRVHFNHAVVMENRRVYLGLWGAYLEHDLWYTDLPEGTD